MNLARKYRPATYGDIIGQNVPAAILYRMARYRRIPPGLLLSGPRGSGKTSSARIFAASLNCTVPPGAPGNAWPCTTCPSCKAVAAADGSSLDVWEVDAASHGSVDDIRDICAQLRYGTGGEYRVVLLDEVHSASRAGFDAMLKELEEPPPLTSFVLLTTERGRVPGTVASRCIQLSFRPVSVSVIAQRLSYICGREGYTAEPELLDLLAEQADGAVRDGVMLLEQAAALGTWTVAAWRELYGRHDFAPALWAAAASGNHTGLYAALDEALSWTADYAWVIRQLVGCLRDLLVLGEGGPVSAQGAALAARQDLVTRLSPAAVVEAMRILWDMLVRIRLEDRRAGLEMALALAAERLAPQAREVPAASNGHKKDFAGTAAAFGAR